MKPLKHSNILLLIAACLSFTGVKAQNCTSSCTSKACTKVQVQVNYNQERIEESLASLASVPEVQVYVYGLEALSALESLPQPNPQPNTAEVVVGVSAESGQPTGPYSSEKTKSLNRTFKVSSSDKLNIQNQFGDVVVQTWNRNEIAVEVNIIARAATDAKAQEILDKITVNVSESGNQIFFETEQEPMNIRTNSVKSFEVNYIVKMPKSNPLKISHRFGNVKLPDLEGVTDINVKHGGLVAGRLTNRQNSITLEHASGDNSIEFMKAGDLKIKHSKIRINEANLLDFNSAHSKVVLGKVETLHVDSQHDPSFKIGSVNQLTGKGSFTVFQLGNLTESAKLELRHGPKFELGSVSQNFKRIDIDGEFTQINLNFSPNNAFNFNVDTEFGGLKANPELVKLSFKEVKNTSASYKGNYGSSAPKSVVTVTTKHGTVTFN